MVTPPSPSVLTIWPRKLTRLSPWFNEGYGQFRPGRLADQAGKAGAAADVEEMTAGTCQAAAKESGNQENGFRRSARDRFLWRSG